MSDIPGFLVNHADLYRNDPRKACCQWLKDAKYGLFLHYGLYSLLGRHEWVQYREQIRVAEYATLQQYFIADKFDADFIAEMALAAEMKYICITTRHHDSFSLWDTKETSFNSVNAPCGRDLVAELAEACEKNSLGLCLYYSHGRDWRHPHAPNNDKYGKTARPHYDPPEPVYATGEAHDLNIYLDFMTAQITELLTNYGPVASIWLDGIGTPREGNIDAFKCQELYDHIHSLQPQVLVSYKNGLTGTEDYYAPEEQWKGIEELNDKPTEVCGCISGGWGYTAGTKHRNMDQTWDILKETLDKDCNLLLNTGPMPNGAIDPRDVETLKLVGERIRKEGYPSDLTRNTT